MNPLDRGQPGPLPGWITTWTDDGRVYFHHKERNVTTWDDPSGGVATLPQRHVPGEKRKRELETDAEAEARELEFLNQQSRLANQEVRKRMSDIPEEERAPTVCVMAPEKVRGRLPKVQFWYYKDTEDNMQGPFYPGQMKGWLTDGFFTGTLKVGPNGPNGEVPTEFYTINSLFDKPLQHHAFNPGPGIPNMAPGVMEVKKPQSREELVKELSNFRGSGKLLYYGMC